MQISGVLAVTVRSAELTVAMAGLLLSVVLMMHVWQDGLAIGWVEGRGPGAGMWPFWLSGGMALASLATIARWYFRITPESRSSEPYIDPAVVVRISVIALSLVALLLLMDYIGTYLALMLFMGFYAVVMGRHGWKVTLGMVLGTPVAVYLLFEWALAKYLPKGLPVFEEGFLVIDNIRYTYF